MTPVAELSVYLAWIVVMESAERQAVVQFHATVGHIQGGYGDTILLREVFPQRKMKGGVPRQIVSGILGIRQPIRESGAVVHIG